MPRVAALLLSRPPKNECVDSTCVQIRAHIPFGHGINTSRPANESRRIPYLCQARQWKLGLDEDRCSSYLAAFGNHTRPSCVIRYPLARHEGSGSRLLTMHDEALRLPSSAGCHSDCMRALSRLPGIWSSATSTDRSHLVEGLNVWSCFRRPLLFSDDPLSRHLFIYFSRSLTEQSFTSRQSTHPFPELLHPSESLHNLQAISLVLSLPRCTWLRVRHNTPSGVHI